MYTEKNRSKKRDQIMNNIAKFNRHGNFIHHIEENDCMICLEPLKESDFRNFDCNRHLTHVKCYNDWRVSNKKHNCPFC